MAKMQELTREGLDCIGLELYIDLDTSLDESMQEIQMAFQYHSLPSDAMSIFRNRAFNGEVFRFMDEEDFEEYLRDRYPDMDLDFAC
jgi:hypothetical protein